MSERLNPSMTTGLEIFKEDHVESEWYTPTTQEEYQLAIAGAQRWLKRTREVPPELAAPAPERTRDVRYERESLGLYLQRLAHQAPEYAEFVADLSEACPPMDENCRLAITIPARQEGQTIYGALQHMLLRKDGESVRLAQTNKDGSLLDPRTYEVTIGINHNDKGDETDTRGAVEAFKRFADEKNLPLSVNILDVTLPPGFDNVGMIRRIMDDVTFMRSCQREHQNRPLYIATEDADICGYDSEAFSSYIRHLDEHPDRSAARLRYYFDVYALKEVPYSFIQQRLAGFTLALLRSTPYEYPNNPVPHRYSHGRILGAGTAITAADLANAGGFPIIGKCEDMLFGEHLSVLHGREHTDGSIIPAYDVVGKEYGKIVRYSARRLIASHVSNILPYEGDSFTDETMTQLTRQPIEELISFAQERNVGSSRKVIESLLQSSLDVLMANAPDEATATRTMKTIMVLLGFEKDDYQLNTGQSSQIAVNDWSNIERRVENYTPGKRIAKAAFDPTEL